MISAGKLKANRANARASTGPKTVRGKIRSAQNARRHGLNISILADPACAAEVENLAHEIVPEGATAELVELARRVAEAQLDLRRIRQARQYRIDSDLRNPNYIPRDSYLNLIKRMQLVVHIEDLEQEQKPIPSKLIKAIERYDVPKPKGYKKLIWILCYEPDVMDRYEQRTLSRRKFAIRAFDLARRRAVA